MSLSLYPSYPAFSALPQGGEPNTSASPLPVSLVPAKPLASSANPVANAYLARAVRLSKAHLHREAQPYFQQATTHQPSQVKAWLQLGNNALHTDSPTVAIQAGKSALAALTSSTEPDTIRHEQALSALLLLGQAYHKSQQPLLALQVLQQAQQVAPNLDDVTRRIGLLNLEQTHRGGLMQGDVLLSSAQLSQVAAPTLEDAQKLILQYFTARNRRDLVDSLFTIPVRVLGTDKQEPPVAGLAEYRHANREIVLTPELAFAKPPVVAAYWLHELVHAWDNDALTSIMEEEDGYRAAIPFWDWVQKDRKKAGLSAVNELNLDFAHQSWVNSVDKLDFLVRDTYAHQLPGVLESSPGHGRPLISANPTQERENDLQEQSDKLAQYENTRQSLLAEESQWPGQIS